MKVERGNITVVRGVLAVVSSVLVVMCGASVILSEERQLLVYDCSVSRFYFILPPFQGLILFFLLPGVSFASLTTPPSMFFPPLRGSHLIPQIPVLPLKHQPRPYSTSQLSARLSP